jgi:hypothetical protein
MAVEAPRVIDVNDIHARGVWGHVVSIGEDGTEFDLSDDVDAVLFDGETPIAYRFAPTLKGRTWDSYDVQLWIQHRTGIHYCEHGFNENGPRCGLKWNHEVSIPHKTL